MPFKQKKPQTNQGTSSHDVMIFYGQLAHQTYVLYSHNHNQYINHKCKNTIQIHVQKQADLNTYTVNSVVQIRMVLLTSNFGSSTRGERDNSYYAVHTILPHKRAMHLVVFKVSVGRDLQNSTVENSVLYAQLSACMVQS